MSAMGTHEAAEALLAWSLEIAGNDALDTDSLLGGYPYEPLGKSVGLPDVVVEILTMSRKQAGTDPRFPQWNLQQRALLVVFDAQLSVMADVGETEEDNFAAAIQVRRIADALLDAVWADLTLGERFSASAIDPQADFTPGWIRYPDGATGRNVTISLTVAKIAGG